MFHVKQPGYDVVVIGAGHAGVEAAMASARLGARTALVTLSRDGIGAMSCNPAIGGIGKGHLVREIDALGGVMGRAADHAGIQFRLLNRRKGPAVQGPRAQTDRAIYKTSIAAELAGAENLDTIIGEAVDFRVERGRVAGVVLSDGGFLAARATILTAGTFLRGVIHIGHERRQGGRWGDKPSNRLAARIEELGLPLGRLKTGTPPRLDGNTIAWDALEKQPGDSDPVLFSYNSTAPFVPQVDCAITHTNELTHDIIAANLSRSAMHGGAISGPGPRYCPSIEDKVVRFPDKNAHQIFLEPEGLDNDTIYPNGISTSLPIDVQMSYVRSVRGLEGATILQPGYAIEYDYVDPTSLTSQLSLSQLPGLFFAGQINGTTGYEEAAAQGLVAGTNAALEVLGKDPFFLSRSVAYIGVMIDDLITRGVSEPYRMFTSRAEFRLSLRADNADQRLTPIAIDTGLVSGRQRQAFKDKCERLERVKSRLTKVTYTPKDLLTSGIHVSQDGSRRDGMQVLALPNVEFSDLVGLDPKLLDTRQDIRVQVARDAIYASYVRRQQTDIEAILKDESRRFPTDFSFSAISGLSNELRSKLTVVRPETLGQAARIEGMTPAALVLLLAKIRQAERLRTA